MKKAAVPSILVAVVLLALGVIAEAQQPKKAPRVGVLWGGNASDGSTRREALRQGLRDLGYVEEKNIAFEYRYADGKTNRLPTLAAELVRLQVDVIVTTPIATRPAMEATNTIPIITPQLGDPVGSGRGREETSPGCPS
jgi:putative ABC transport system substrate-binding protein